MLRLPGSRSTCSWKKDNGIGFEINALDIHEGMGLNNMRYRLQSGNGDIDIVSEHGKGMRANAYLKVN